MVGSPSGSNLGLSSRRQLDLICSAVLSRGHGEAAPGWLRGRRFWWPDQVDELACVSVLDGAVRLIFAGWLPQDGLFGWNASAGLKVERGAGVMNPFAAHRSNADRSSRGRLLIVLVRLLGGWVVEDFGWFHAPGRRGHSSIQASPAGAWEESTWSTRSAASMNDVDAEEHRQTMSGRGTTLAGSQTVLGLVPGHHHHLSDQAPARFSRP